MGHTSGYFQTVKCLVTGQGQLQYAKFTLPPLPFLPQLSGVEDVATAPITSTLRLGLPGTGLLWFLDLGTLPHWGEEAVLGLVLLLWNQEIRLTQADLGFGPISFHHYYYFLLLFLLTILLLLLLFFLGEVCERIPASTFRPV
jgi:hypothetical protein